jgi:uncharacterized membrane protein YkvA (DUF1232 family)
VGSSPTPGTVTIWEWLLISALVVVALYAIAVVVLATSGRQADAAALARFIPDCVVLFQRLLADPRVDWWRKAILVLAIVYLASPIDLVPDFIPVLGYADDAIIVSLVLRSVVRRAGPQVIRRHWQGTPDGLAALSRLAGIELQASVKVEREVTE